MGQGYLRYFIGFFVTIGLIILLIVLLFGGGDKEKTKAPDSPKELTSLATSGGEVRMTIDGPVNADQIHEQIRVTVNANTTTFELINGYQGNVVKSQTYQNNQEAYTNFLHALNVAGYTNGDNSSKLKNDQGYCPLGTRNIFETFDSGKTVRYWTTSCGKPKSYLGNRNLTLQLFRAQVPDYNKLTDDASIF